MGKHAAVRQTHPPPVYAAPGKTDSRAAIRSIIEDHRRTSPYGAPLLTVSVSSSVPADLHLDWAGFDRVLGLAMSEGVIRAERHPVDLAVTFCDDGHGDSGLLVYIHQATQVAKDGEPGFSHRMDSASAHVRDMGGRFSVLTCEDRGTAIMIRVPATVARHD